MKGDCIVGPHEPYDYEAAYRHVERGGVVLVVPALKMGRPPLVLKSAESEGKGFLFGWIDTRRGRRAAIVHGTEVYIAYDKKGKSWVPHTNVVGGLLMRRLVA